VRPVKQLIPGGGFESPPDQRGDCFRACVASILEVDPRELPNPHGAEHWGDAWDRALGPFGLWVVWLGKHWWPTGERAQQFEGYWIAAVPSPRIEGNHCVVMRGTEVVHDPTHARPIESIRAEDVQEATLFLPFDPAPSVIALTRMVEPA
jgi:hypothetical protein